MDPIATSSPYPMISVQDALGAILGRAEPLAPVAVDFLEAQGLVLAEDVAADEDLPKGPRSAVDGYAVTGSREPRTLRVLGELTAGQVSGEVVGPDSALRIMTGGLLPPGAEAVVMVEDTRERDGLVEIGRPAAAGENVTPTGHDLRRGELVLAAGTVLGPAEIGMLAAVGQTRVRVHPRPKVAVLA